MSLSIPLLVLVAGCAGPETTVNKLYPDIAVAPLAVDFGEIEVSDSGTQLVQVINAGRVDLQITDVTVKNNDDDETPIFSATPSTATVPEEESMGIQITFAPLAYETYAHTLVIHSDDPDSPEFEVALSGIGTDGPIPDIALDCDTLDFGDVAPSDTATGYCTINNEGDGPLNIASSLQTGSGAFQLATYPDGQRLAEGDYFLVVIDYAPVHDLGDRGVITIASDDPDEGEVDIELIGNGGGKGVYPIAEIDCPSAVEPPSSITLDGSGSYDPGGLEPLTWSWSIVGAPVGNVSAIDDPAAESTTLDVNLAGSWDIALVVTNTAGVPSAPARCTFNAVPIADVVVEVVWDTDDSDLDLHLVQEGSALFETPGDCCWCNENPAWGTSSTDDDPALVLDEESGYGPELVRVLSPADDDYYARVHYFEDLGGGTTTVTVRFWMNGELADEMQTQLTHNQVWDVGYVRWPEGVVVPENTDPYEAPTKYCY